MNEQEVNSENMDSTSTTQSEVVLGKRSAESVSDSEESSVAEDKSKKKKHKKSKKERSDRSLSEEDVQRIVQTVAQMFNIQAAPGPSYASHPLGGPFPPGGVSASASGELHGSGQVFSPEEGYRDEDGISLHPRESEAGSGNSERSSRARLREV